MSTSILKGIYLAIHIAHDHHRCFTHKGGAVLTGLCNIDLETQVIPGCALKQAFLFLLMNVIVRIQTVRDPVERIALPMNLVLTHGIANLL